VYSAAVVAAVAAVARVVLGYINLQNLYLNKII